MPRERHLDCFSILWAPASLLSLTPNSSSVSLRILTMDLAYDAITQSSYDNNRATTPTPPKPTDEPSPQATPKAPPRQNLQTEFQETFKALSASPWGAKLGGWWSSTTKQSQSYYEEAVKEAEDLRVDALKGFNDLKQNIVTRTRGMSGGDADLPPATPDTKEATEEEKIAETETFLDKFKAEAAKRLKDVQAAEDAADQALLRFGTNIRNFLKDAVVITEPDDEQQSGEVIFESKDQSGKRVVHASRLDGQLYAIHTTPEKFTHDPEDEGGQWSKWKEEFDIEGQTETIAKDLDRYPELRAMMERTKEEIEYKDFWTRYYFLRMVLEAHEAKRKELLKGENTLVCRNQEILTVTASTNDTEEVAWDEDSDDENVKPSTPQIMEPIKLISSDTNESSTTLHQPDAAGLKPEGRRSHDEKSVADSEASYDMISGAPSRAASSPKERRADESDEEDWE